MLLWNGTEFVQFVGSTREVQIEVANDGSTVVYEIHKPCVKNEPLGDHDTVARQAPKFLEVLREFLADPKSSFVGGNAPLWRMRIERAAGGVL